ncbi:MAG: hypothetical protein ACPL7A_00230, partial [Anaerolineales bacterium]
MWYFTSRQPQELATKDTTLQRLDLSKIPEPKLVAEYRFDSPITDAVFYENGKPKVVATEAFIRFYNPDG